MRDLDVLSAVGVNSAGKREILGVSVSLSEHEVHWLSFVESLKGRGLGGVRLVSSILSEISEEWLTRKIYISFEGAI